MALFANRSRKSKEIGVQCQACDVSALNINTDCATTEAHGVFHKEGGWPRDVNPQEADQTARYRKKIEKDEAYLFPQTPDPNPLRTLHLLKDPSPIKRAVTGLSWSPDVGTKLAAAYSDPFWKNLFDHKENDSYIWNIERAVQLEIILRSMSQLRSVSFNPRDQHILAGGSIYGAVGIWDVRKSQGPVECVPIGVGHSESVTSLIWSNSKAGVLRILLSLWRRPSIVMNCNRRARTTAERIMCQYEAHLGPVHGLHRHLQLPKIFLTVGDWTTNVWTEDIRDSPILTLKNQNVQQLLDGAWSHTRPSVIFTAATDGALYLWDILAQRITPTLCSQVVSESPLLSLNTQEHGKIMAVGSKDGRLSVIQISDNLSTVTKNDKVTLTSETLQALNINQENTSGKEVNEGSVIEPSADMLPATDKTGSLINVSVSHAAPVGPSVDQTLQSSEEAFFEIETIDQA
ncbi:hypothetical protein DAPPUDRAFT_262127 [Daphnia pulex]|uniref:Uncharacterized protein n=1 Tax=Daphnia pulex TaxID=6669 RepID=E9HME8_DAPPU|nr:hypothetical protein DAPPUDRAFT_262127 [Daphnia pulex]|eukprot:EFX67062.1 hypothetical protein DAPPUDRAFT_262127 [Daphnia pulex]